MSYCLSFPITVAAFLCISLTLRAQEPVRVTLHLEEPGAAVSPGLYGLMTEEINFSYEGGLYGELIRNRSFKDSAKVAAFWSLMPGTSGKATMSLDKQNPVSPALPVSLRLDVENAGDGVGIANEGYWGMAVRPNTTYKGSFFVRSSAGGGQSLRVALESRDGKTVFASSEVAAPGADWKRAGFSLTTTAGIVPTADARFVIRAGATGSYWFSLVSLFPPTYKDRRNGNRQDIMQLLADMKPAFLRLPGGNYVEGNTFSQRWDWKKTIGPIEQRPGHLSPWHYRSTDGLGLLEFLEWCEDLDMEPLVAVFAGYVLNRDYLEAGPFLQPFVDDALDEIEYITGDVNTKWGAQRAKDGHPQPFPLHYIEIGNEDGFDASGSYEGRYAQFHDAIKARYPQLHIISTVGGKDGLGGRFPAPAGRTEIVDEHYYRNAWQMEENAGQYDSYDRNGPKVFVGEWATREGDPTTNFNAALGDAAWMTGMERNSDLVIMSCYAPLFVNVNPGGMQWKSDLIGYNALTSFGSPAYHAQKMFSTHLGDRVIKMTMENIPSQLQKLGARDSAAGVQPKKIDALFFSATHDTKKGLIYLKVVNTQAVAQAIAINLAGVGKVAKEGTAWTLAAAGPTETNSITEPRKIVPVESVVKGLGKAFVRTFPPYSITVLQIKD
ncbi:MAG TPA: alpha-L-arabinofuranosidase C-terminal domain-containing protein [Puia sp.]|nr:alpha-L-arabinofuranosidase C-terminal domain-containing protein [Puia sp.]